MVERDIPWSRDKDFTCGAYGCDKLIFIGPRIDIGGDYEHGNSRINKSGPFGFGMAKESEINLDMI